MDQQKYDARTIDRYIRDGVVSEEEYESYLASLPDVAAKGEKVEAEFVQGILEDDEEGEEEGEEDDSDE